MIKVFIKCNPIKQLIEIESKFRSKEIKITGLYDPEDYDLDIYMWSNSDGDQLKIYLKLSKLESFK